ncbi:PH domain-containing protein [Haloplanus salinarum]|uniref:PH domain-containing protein n=1 Tax=Haloplanus salinarum TaxID=1912324 RepID=UPI00214B93F4|nr:PH domain-containing protein [Haloplanus salinarum]
MNRLHPRVRVVWAGQAAIVAVALAGVTVAVDRLAVDLPVWVPPAVLVVVLGFGVGLALARYRVWRYEVRDDALYLERGVFTRVRTVVPFVRLQHVDSSRGPVERLLGLASAVVYTAGSRGADVRIPGLTPAGADDLRERLKRLAIRAEGDDAV